MVSPSNYVARDAFRTSLLIKSGSFPRDGGIIIVPSVRVALLDSHIGACHIDVPISITWIHFLQL